MNVLAEAHLLLVAFLFRRLGMEASPSLNRIFSGIIAGRKGIGDNGISNPVRSFMRVFIMPVLILVQWVSAADLTMLGVSRGNLVNGEGEEIVLRGMNMDLYYGRVENDPEAPFLYASEEDIEYLAELGCNSLRLCLHWKLFETGRGFDLVDTYLSWCQPRGIYLILDMHRVPPENGSGSSGIWNSSEAQDALCDMWASIAARYANNPGIAGYDIFNEPSPDTPDLWWNLAQRVADTIRVEDENHILFIETPGGRCSDLRLIDDTNTAYSIHCYDPFTISHAGAEWPGDSPVPCNSTYPGDVLTGVEWVGWSSGTARLTERAPNWMRWNSGAIVIPEGVELVSLKAYLTGNTGPVQFDEFEVSLNGRDLTVLNGGIEDFSSRRPGQPASWVFYTDGDFNGTAEGNAFRGSSCLGADGSRGTASWIQTRSYYTAPLFPVQPGDSIQVTGMIRAPMNRGEIALGLDYLVEKREDWSRSTLRERLQYAVQWAESNEVPLYVGEFGSLPGAGYRSRNNLISDWISVLNQEKLHWAFWTYRNPGDQAFGLFYNNSQPDETLSEILLQGYSGN